MMKEKSCSIEEKKERRVFGAHLTSVDIFMEFIYPEIKAKLDDYLWVDLYAGEGNLILPILKNIKADKREEFFVENIFLFDIQKKMIDKCIENAQLYGISKKNAKKNITTRDNLENFPDFLKSKDKPIFHITNPPYLYLGYISKHKSTEYLMKYFKEQNKGYQDLYQIAMMNDLRNKIENIIYIIPTNFLYGASVSNKFRFDFLKHYNIQKMVIFETKIFQFTGTNICIGFFNKKKVSDHNINTFIGTKMLPNSQLIERKYILDPSFKYRAGSEFDAFLQKYKNKKPLKVNYYLFSNDIKQNLGKYKVKLLDANKYKSGRYELATFNIDYELYNKIISNILYVRTVDTGSIDGRVGLGIIKEDFNIDGIFVSGNTYRTHPIQIFLSPRLSKNEQEQLKNYFNFILESFRNELDSEFLTTYKYSNASYTRKFLGLTQVRKLIETFPFNLSKDKRTKLAQIIAKKNIKDLMQFLLKLKS